jgi:hypothetical protein
MKLHHSSSSLGLAFRFNSSLYGLLGPSFSHTQQMIALQCQAMSHNYWLLGILVGTVKFLPR